MSTTEQAARPAFVLSGAEEIRTTRYSDVCGGTDEFKRVLNEEAAQAATPEGRKALRSLVDDGIYMLARMEVRLREYQAFRDEVEQIVKQMRTLDEPRLADAQREAEQLRATLDGGGSLEQADLVHRAEEIRQVANDMEGALRRHKEACIAIGKAYLALKGPRGWEDSSQPAGAASSNGHADGAAQNGAAQDGAEEPLPAWIPEAWLPPAPHREKIVDWLKRGRAALLSEEETAKHPVGPQGREPIVQFEDGGFMPLRVVRWSEEVRNFHPLGTTPHPRGRLYRGRSANPTAEAQPAS